MKHSLVTPTGTNILLERQVKEKKTDSGILLSDEKGAGDFLVWGTVTALSETSREFYRVGDKLIFHELSVEGGFRDTDEANKDFILVPAEKILGTYGG